MGKQRRPRQEKEFVPDETQAPPCTHSPRATACSHGAGMSRCGAPQHVCASVPPSLGGWGVGLGSEAAPSFPLSLGAGSLRQQAAGARPGVTLRGGCGQEQGAHSAAVATSGQPTGCPEAVRGGDWPRPGETGAGQRQGLRETKRWKKRSRDRDRKGTRDLGCISRLPGFPMSRV